MDDSIERISTAVGPKWPSLISELALPPEVKSRIETMHSGEQKPGVKDILCCKEALKMWQNKPHVKVLSEEHQMTELLRIIKNISFLKDMALELSFMYFVSRRSLPATRVPVATGLVPPGQITEPGVAYRSQIQPVMSLSRAEYIGHPRMYGHRVQPRLPHYDRLDPSRYSVRTYSEHPLTTRTVEVTRGHEYVGVSGDIHQTLPPTCQTNGFTSTTEAAIAIPPVIVRDPCDEIIYVRDRYHRYALLDASQRILRCTWDKLAQKLNITKEAIEKLENEKDFQERYFRLFMEYVRQHGENATFTELRKALRECNEQLAVDIMEERLRTRKEIVISAVEYDFLLNKDL